MSENKNKYAVIFDMDGVLVNSKDKIRKSFERVFDEYDIESPEGGMHRGKSLKDQLEAIETNNGIKLDISVDEFSQRATKYQLGYLKRELPDKKLMELLEKLRANHFALAVATSSFRDRAEKILQLFNVSGYFELLVTVEDVNHVSKPNPDIFLKTAESLNVTPEECVVIEDAQSGVDAANAAGMKSIGFVKYHPGETLENCDFLAKDFDEISLSKIKDLLNLQDPT